MMTPSSSITIGTTNPKAAMLSAICRICLREWVRVLRTLGVSLSIAIQKISIMRRSYDAEAKRTGFDLRRVKVQIVSRSSGSDHIHADRIAFLLARTARLTVSHVGSLRAPASPRLPLRRASPAGLAKYDAPSSIA